MEHRRKNTPEDGLTPKKREDLERIVVRLLEVAARSEDPAVKYELMKLADELVKLLES
jgi:hypothetical protein